MFEEHCLICKQAYYLDIGDQNRPFCSVNCKNKYNEERRIELERSNKLLNAIKYCKECNKKITLNEPRFPYCSSYCSIINHKKIDTEDVKIKTQTT